MIWHKMKKQSNASIRLTSPEARVLDRLVLVTANKPITVAFSISVKTVEVHRAPGMHKMTVTSVAEHATLCVGADVCQGKP
jgi:FixJ family two-component response regulator